MTKKPTKQLRKKVQHYLLVFSSLILLSAIPYFAGSGLDNAEPIGAYLNSNFPSALPQGLPYQPVFPNITFDSPLTFNELPNDNKIIVGQRDGKIFWFDKNPNVSVKNSMIDLSDKVGLVWDGGFLGLALHPQFGTAGKNYFYVWYTTEDGNSNDFPDRYTRQSCDSEEYWGNFLVLARYEANPNTLAVQASSEQTLLKLRMYGTTHRGGGLVFGDDGFLYLTTGDQTAFKKSQDIVNNLDGGVLRLDVDQDNTKSHPPVRTMPNDHGYADEITGNGYYIPNDNPFLSPAGENFEEYYSMGHRNPHRMTKDRATGELYVGEIGGGRHEEINIVKKGGNFGWPLYEGLYRSTFCVSGLYNNMPHEQPLVAFPRSEANAIIGGYVYRGNEIPELQGKYLCADYGSGEEIFTVDINTGAYEQYGNFTSTNIISFGEDKQGELYILKQGVSSLYKVTSKNTGLGNTPQLLSQTGAFSDLSNLTPTDGLIPYDLVESFWSDGALKKRWMAIPNDGSHNTAGEKIAYSDVDDWDFPIGSVLVKHFELPIDERNPSITKRLETRFSIKASDGNFYFVTYKWNNQQTDATLLTSGLEESINIIKADGSADTQTWSYPSNIDCVSCHNPTTGGAIGAQAKYLNKDYTYPKTGRTGNQLVTLSHLGILDQVISDGDTNSILTSKSQNDPTASLDDKARSYLDLNCAYCHRPGTGNRGDFDLRLNLDILQTGVLTASPYLPLGIPNEKIVDPGNVATSILYHRMNSTDPAIRMPPIAKNEIDATAVQMIDDWISQLDPDPCADRIIMETFANAPGTTIPGLKSFVNFPDAPSAVDELNEFRIPINAGDDYGVRVKGLLKAPETGTYYFWITGDDNVELNLSTDANANNITRIAYHENWSLDGQWDKYATQKSAGVNLVAGQNYYIEALMNERGGGDNLSVGWRKPSNGNGDDPFQVIPCTAFDYFSGPPIVNVTGVTLDPVSASIDAGNLQQLTATVSPTDATDTSVTWSSSNANIATVDSNGLVTGIDAGLTTITATTTDGNFISESTITVLVPTTGITVNPQTLSLAEGSTSALTTTVSPSNASDTSVSWQSSDDTIATISIDGTVTAVATGTATITATTTDGGFSDESVITVFQPTVDVIGIAVNPQTLSLAEGSTSALTATVSPSNASDTSVTWSSSDDTIATVSTNGTVTAVATGTATITATTTDGGFSDESVITVFQPTIDVTGITVNPQTLSLAEGSTSTLTATVSPSNASDTSVSWQSSDDTIATVSTNGTVTAVATGTATITATTTDGGFSDESVITVFQPTIDVTGIVVNPQTISLAEGSTSTLTATVSPSNASDTSISWQSSDDTIATVSIDGTVTAVATGTATITATTTDGGFSDESIITVFQPTIDVTGIAVSPQTISLAEGSTSTLTATVNPSNASDTSVSWQSSDDTIVTVSIDGTVTAVATGTATITATTTDGGFSDESVITVFQPTIDVTGIVVNPQTISLAEGSSTTLIAAVSPSNASDTSVSWQSSDDTIATVSIDGTVTAVATGTATITATTIDGGFSDESVITVFQPTIDVTGIAVSPQTIGLAEGSTSTLTATVSPSNASDTSVSWQSSDDTIATVSIDGSVTAVATGTATITATTTDGGFSDESVITVFQPTIDVTGIVVNPQMVSLAEGNSTTLTAAVSPSNASDTSVSWQSSDDTIATVSIDGSVTAVATGTATITATTIDGGFSDESVITVFQPTIDVTGIAVSPQTIGLAEGSTSTLTATVSPSNASDTSVSWQSSDDTIATVSATGLVTAVAVGDAIITATTTDGNFTAQADISVVEENGQDCTASGTITMRRYDNIAGITLNSLFDATSFPDNPSSTVELNSFEIPAYVSNNYGAWVNGFLCAPETGTYYFWISGDDHVRLNLSTDDDAANKTTIAFHNGHTNYRMWDRYDSQKSIGIQLIQGQSYYIEGFVKEGVGGDHLAVGWRKPSDGIGEEPSEIIPGNVLSPNQDIPYQIAVTGITIDRSFATLLEGDSTTLTAQVNPSNAANQNITWQSSNNNVATVDTNGVVTAIAVGNAVITVTTSDGGFTAQSNITVREEDDLNCSATGTISMRRYDNIGGVTLNDLFVASIFPDNPSSSVELNSFEIPKHVADNYGAWVSGYLCAPETGTYYFWVSGDNYVQLNLSVDDTIANATTIAYHTGHTNNRDWNKYESQKSIAIELVQGQSYYIEAYLKELNGGDHLAVGWSKPSDDNADLPSEIIPGTVLSPNSAQSFPLQASLKDFIDVAIITVFPNPATEYVNIETYGSFQMISIAVFDSSGRVVRQLNQDAFRSNGQEYQLNTSELAKGVYTLQIVTNDFQRHSEKVIIR